MTERPTTRLHGYQNSLLDADDRAAAEAESMAEAFAEAAAAASSGGHGGGSGAAFAAASAIAGGASAGGTGGGGESADATAEEEGAEAPDYGLDESARGWGDWCKARLHANACVAMRAARGSGGGGGGSGGLASAHIGLHTGRGKGSYGEVDGEALEEAIRTALEASDSVQGFVLLCDADSGWGGLGVAAAELMRDQCRSAAVLAIPVMEPFTSGVHASWNAQGESAAAAMASAGSGEGMAEAESASQWRACRRINTALTWGGLAEFSTAVVPMSTQAYVEACAAARASGRAETDASWMVSPHWAARSSSVYHSSALLAHALDLLLTPTRVVGAQSSELMRGCVAGLSHRLRLAELCAVAGGAGGSAEGGRFLSCATTVPLPDPFSDAASLSASLQGSLPPAHATSGPWALPLCWPEGPAAIRAEQVGAGARAAGSYATSGALYDGDDDDTATATAAAGSAGGSSSAGARHAGVALWSAAASARRFAEAGRSARGLFVIGRGWRPPVAGTASAAASAGEGARGGALLTVGGWADRWLAEAGVSTARHCLWATPLPVPLSHPRAVFHADKGLALSVDGCASETARARSLRNRAVLVPGSASRSTPARGWHAGWDTVPPSSGAAASPVSPGKPPETLSGLLRVGLTAEMGPALRWCASGLIAADRRVLHRMLGEDEGSAGAAVAPEDWRSVAESLIARADGLGGEVDDGDDAA